MTTRTISVKDIYKLFPNNYNKTVDAVKLIKVELLLEINFETFGQVQYTDQNGRLWIKEFQGKSWSIEFLVKEPMETKFSVFMNNLYLQKGGNLRLIKKVDNEIFNQMEFELSGDKLFEGWFKLS